MYVTLGGAILNAILDPIFIFGFGLGIHGAATKPGSSGETGPGKIRRPSIRSGPQAKQLGKGWPFRPG